MVLDSNHKEYSVPLKELEIEGLPAKEDEVTIGTKVVWLHRDHLSCAKVNVFL